MVRFSIPWAYLAGVLAGISLGAGPAFAAPHVRGLVVAIDQYNSVDCAPGMEDFSAAQRSIPELRGALNDADAFIKAVRHRLGSRDFSLETLYNAEATRDAILAGIKRDLVEPAKAGDIVIFYFSGHGSQVRNSLSVEANKLDETIVPADAICGAYDIRDKELATLFQSIVDKGAWLYAFFDSCHSGSIARGGSDIRFRLAPPSGGRDVADGNVYAVPELSGKAAIFSASQHYQLATELEIEGTWRGLFTYAVQQVLLSDSIADNSLQDLSKRVRALMEAQARVRQFPTLQATHSMQQRPLFMPESSAPRAPVSFHLSAVDSSRELVAIPAGLRDGLLRGTRLVATEPTETNEAEEQTHVRAELELEIIDAKLSTSVAKPVSGSLDTVGPGTPVFVSRWGSQPTQVWIESSELIQGLEKDLAFTNHVVRATEKEKSHFELEFSLRPSCQCQMPIHTNQIISAELAESGRENSSLTRKTWHWRLRGGPANLYWGSEKFASDWFDTRVSESSWFSSEAATDQTRFGIIEIIDDLAKWHRLMGLHAPNLATVLPYRTEIRHGGWDDAIEPVEPHSLVIGAEYSVWLVLDEQRLPRHCTLVPQELNLYLLNLTYDGNIAMFFPLGGVGLEDDNPVQLKVALDANEQARGQYEQGPCRLRRQVRLGGFDYAPMDTNSEFFLLLSTDVPVTDPERQLQTTHTPRTDCGCQILAFGRSRGPGISERWAAEHIEVRWTNDALSE